MVDAMETSDSKKYPHDFAIPPSRIFLGEGATIQTTTPAINQYFQDVFQVLMDKALAGIQMWVTDTLGDARDAKGTPTLSPVTPAYDLFTTAFTFAGVRTYANLPPGISWHGSPAAHASYADPASYPAYEGVRPAAYGRWSYGKPTAKGRWVQQAIADHTDGLNVRFYASPNPIESSARAGSTVLHWDAVKMTRVGTIEIHAETVFGPLVAKGGASGSAGVNATVADGSDFVLIDTTAGRNRVLATVTIEAP
jgi:hypothetical protein